MSKVKLNFLEKIEVLAIVAFAFIAAILTRNRD